MKQPWNKWENKSHASTKNIKIKQTKTKSYACVMECTGFWINDRSTKLILRHNPVYMSLAAYIDLVPYALVPYCLAKYSTAMTAFLSSPRSVYYMKWTLSATRLYGNPYNMDHNFHILLKAMIHFFSIPLCQKLWLYRCFSAKLQYLQCVSNQDAAVLHETAGMFWYISHKDSNIHSAW